MGQGEADQQNERDDRIDDRDRIPRDARLAERPQQERAVAGAGIEHAVRCVSDGSRREVGAPSPAGRTMHQPGQTRNEPAHRNEHEGVREVAVELGVEERVRTAADQSVDIRQQRAEGPRHQRGGPQRSAGDHPRRGRSRERVCEWIHTAIGPHPARIWPSATDSSSRRYSCSGVSTFGRPSCTPGAFPQLLKKRNVRTRINYFADAMRTSFAPAHGASESMFAGVAA
jgi:hypothetical protein